MSARTVESWEVDDWLKSLGIDPDLGGWLSHDNERWMLEMHIPEGVDPDEYLCGLETAWQERFGNEPVTFKEHPPRPISMVTSTGLDLSALKASMEAAFKKYATA